MHTLKTTALAAAILGATALAAQADVVGTLGFSNLGGVSANTGDLATATSLTVYNLANNTGAYGGTGIFAGLGLNTDFGASLTFSLSDASTVSFSDGAFGSFTGATIDDHVTTSGTVTSDIIYVVGDWTPGSYGDVANGSYLASFTFTLNQTAGGAISGGETFSVPPTGDPAAPELSTWAMMGLGFAGLGFAGYRSRRGAVSIAA
jgi:hypothetical protein